MHEVIRIHAAAPPKPGHGEACNGCGVCCASAPCPIGIVASGSVHGPCAALAWHADQSRYRCGLVDATSAARWPRAWRWAAPALARGARRYIAAGSGCDCSLEVGRPGFPG